MGIGRGLIEFRREFGLQVGVEVVFDSFGRGVQLLAGEIEVAGHIRFPQPVRTNDILCESAARIGQLVEGRR